MTGRGTAITIEELLTRLERARDAGRDVGESIRILQEMLGENAGPAWCQCGHVEEAHRHHRRVRDCTMCHCAKFLPGS
jgi:hypothetical protein